MRVRDQTPFEGNNTVKSFKLSEPFQGKMHITPKQRVWFYASTPSRAAAPSGFERLKYGDSANCLPQYMRRLIAHKRWDQHSSGCIPAPLGTLTLVFVRIDGV